ncbi:NAD(P)-dependent oxidoreductase [Brucella sp.]|uniref:NAD(P)-dependent oxidoreductase n=1 Tax=Brucella sp. TaxID=52132 RepID=UPI0028979557|nr:NAD(P)-dependent oxidoreductase [Brucella sp.]
MNIGFVGAGKMGLPIAFNIVRKLGRPITVVDPHRPKFPDELDIDPAMFNFSSSLHDLADCDVVVLCLPDSKVVSAVVEGRDNLPGLSEILRAGSTIIDCSSSIAAETLRLASLLRPRGIAFHDAPVSGGLARAWKGELTVMVGGLDGLNPLMKIIEAFAAKVVPLEKTGDGHVMKTANNYLLAANIISFAEALRFAREAGISFEKFGEVVNSSSGGSYVSLNKIETVARDDDSVSFTTALIAKDVRNFIESCAGIGLELPMSAHVSDLWEETIRKIGPDVDSLKIYRTLGPSAV